jgi:hypothetical protein
MLLQEREVTISLVPIVVRLFMRGYIFPIQTDPTYMIRVACNLL